MGGAVGRFLVSLGVFVPLLFLWSWLLDHTLTPSLSLFLVIGVPLLVIPFSWLGRRWLDHRPEPSWAVSVTLVMHLILVALFGTAIFEAIRLAPGWRGWTLPVPEWVSGIALAISLVAALVTVLSLAVQGLGAPFAIVLSRRLAVGRLYSWTRNPMGLASLALLISVGLRFKSALFLAWVLVLLTPVWLFMVKQFEERELEIRFGDSYREYRARTPFLWPRPPSGHPG